MTVLHVVGGRKYDVECGLVRRGPVGSDWVPMGSDWVISHTGLFMLPVNGSVALLKSSQKVAR